MEPIKDPELLKYEKFRSIDPFPQIAPALLNSADVYDYIQTIGMVSDFEDKQLKGVTLSLRLGDTAVYWDGDGNKVTKNIKKDGEFTLNSNSIAYIQVFEKIRLPAYIIARFNLRVTNAYKGILLGTGPIVDPGFIGTLYIPLHNLTNDNYTFPYMEPLIEMEFTKISPITAWEVDLADKANAAAEAGKIERKGKYKKWEPSFDKIDTQEREISYYLRRANQGRPIKSSLPPLVNTVNKTTSKVNKQLTQFNFIIGFSFVAIIGAIIAIVNIFMTETRELRNNKYDEQIRSLREMHTRDSLKLDAIEKRLNPPVTMPVPPSH